MNEQQWINRDYVGECTGCGEVRPLQMLPDPVAEEIEDDQPPLEPWCFECYVDRCMDV